LNIVQISAAAIANPAKFLSKRLGSIVRTFE